MVGHGDFPERASGGEPQPFTTEDLDTMHRFADYLHVFLDSDQDPAMPVALAQTDAYSVQAEAIRDRTLGILSAKVGFDVDDHLAKDEAMRRERGVVAVVLKPWMKHVLGMDTPEVPILAKDCIRRDAILRETPTRVYAIHELETPNALITPDGVQMRMNRLLYYAQRQV